MSTRLVEAVAAGDGKLAARCPFCGLMHVCARGSRTSAGGVLYVESVCTVRRAFDRDGLRRWIALRIVEKARP
jgi:hypothetical protein